MSTLLSQVRKTLRVTTESYDDEISTYIMACLYDLDRLNIIYDHCDEKEVILDSEDVEPEIILLVSTYTKSKFGNTQENYKMMMMDAYKDLRDVLLVDKSHKKPSAQYTRHEV